MISFVRNLIFEKLSEQNYLFPLNKKKRPEPSGDPLSRMSCLLASLIIPSRRAPGFVGFGAFSLIYY